MSGAPGSGKSTIAQHLARSLGGTVINHDLLKTFFLDTQHAFDEAAKLAYRLDWVLAEDLLKQGHSVVIDSVCNYAELVERGEGMAREYGVLYRFVECRVEEMEVLEGRLRGRVAMRSQRKGIECPPMDAGEVLSVDYRAVLREKMENPVRPVGGAIVVDSSVSVEVSVEEILGSKKPQRFPSPPPPPSPKTGGRPGTRAHARQLEKESLLASPLKGCRTVPAVPVCFGVTRRTPNNKNP
ncbi:hypothetical protein V493_02398 [Pseudogymnoascus sp. VKM F-4281 (FW-2241)]|nr:hypothetical protein V493_02398 [Pseudogymnoascus sp. VKM F-4281 (FW-2241)]